MTAYEGVVVLLKPRHFAFTMTKSPRKVNAQEIPALIGRISAVLTRMILRFKNEIEGVIDRKLAVE